MICPSLTISDEPKSAEYRVFLVLITQKNAMRNSAVSHGIYLLF